MAVLILSRDSQQLIRLVETLFRVLRGRVPIGWAVGLAALLVAYVLAQPYLERTLGVSLPGLARGGTPAGDRAPVAPPVESPGKSPSPATANSYLRDLGNEVYETPAGLRYKRGSQHGHRLKHLLAHAEDMSDRPGQHGVFDDHDLGSLVRLVDAAYEQAERGERVAVRREEGREVFTIDVGKRIGYIGGRSGNRRGRPAARHVRLVLQGKSVITAYPIIPRR
ncbi:MAG: hypothetical protein AAF589_02675 [Planctomycetota bacterium]